MSAILLDSSMVHYEALGQGRPVVFLHGWIGSWRYWINAMQAASTSFRAYALDLFGFGETVRKPSYYSLDRQAHLVNRFLEEMGIGKIALVGHDLGGLVSLSFTRQWRESVDRVMAINCPLKYDALHSRMKTDPPSVLVDWLTARTPETLSALSDASKADPLAVSDSLASFQADNLLDSVRDLNIPCLFVYGANNPALTPPSPETLDLPMHMHYITLDGAGHFPMIDNPSQFNRLLTDFLALDSGISPRELQLKEEWKRRVR